MTLERRRVPMVSSVTRRGFFASFVVAAAAVAGRGAAAAGPARCQHYYDGVLWCNGNPGRERYVRDETRCPFCAAQRSASGPLVAHLPLGSRTTYVYDPGSPPKSCLSQVTTSTYDYTQGKRI